MAQVTVPAETRALLSGNEAIARGAWEAGVRVAAGYPGTPSTEILEVLARHQGADVRWSPNEKVALDVALGASLGGVRALATMKHVGLNVAADTFVTAAYTGVGAGLVVVSADDPGMHSSQNEQDNRFYARFAEVPLLEPSDSSEAKEFTKLGYQISEEFDTPVLLRSTTRVAHCRGIVELEPAQEGRGPGFRRDPQKYVMLPGYARARRPVVLDRLARLAAYAEESPLTVVEERDPAVGVVTAGIAYQYVLEVLPGASTLKLGMSYPLPLERIRAFARRVERLFVVEELEPFLEEALRAAGLAVQGKAFFPRTGELSPDLVRAGFIQAGVLAAEKTERFGELLAWEPVAVPRPPVLCPGCSHATPFMALRQLGAVVAGDIGCYTLAALAPLSAMDTCVAMGSSIGMAVGLAGSGGASGPVVAAIGDSTFLQGSETVAVDLAGLCRSIGVEHVQVVDPYDVGATYVALEAAIEHVGPAVVITNRPCVEAPSKIRDRPFQVDAAACISCQLCMNIGCPSITWTDEWYEGRRKVEIDTATCTGCTVCAQMCPTNAILPVPDWAGRGG